MNQRSRPVFLFIIYLQKTERLSQADYWRENDLMLVLDMFKLLSRNAQFGKDTVTEKYVILRCAARTTKFAKLENVIIERLWAAACIKVTGSYENAPSEYTVDLGSDKIR